jgi:hypothetical protein
MKNEITVGFFGFHALHPLEKPIVESGRDIPYGTINLQKFAHFYVLSAHYIALSFRMRYDEHKPIYCKY